jgi:hypothetical protein
MDGSLAAMSRASFADAPSINKRHCGTARECLLYVPEADSRRISAAGRDLGGWLGSSLDRFGF